MLGMVEIGTDLIPIDHEVMCRDEGFEDDHPAGVGGPLEQRVSQLRNVHVHLVGTVDEIYKEVKTMWELQRVSVPHNNRRNIMWCPVSAVSFAPDSTVHKTVQKKKKLF